MGFRCCEMGDKFNGFFLFRKFSVELLSEIRQTTFFLSGKDGTNIFEIKIWWTISKINKYTQYTVLDEVTNHTHIFDNWILGGGKVSKSQKSILVYRISKEILNEVELKGLSDIFTRPKTVSYGHIFNPRLGH